MMINRIFRHRNDTVYVDYIKLYTSVIIYNILILIINIFLERFWEQNINDYIFNKEYNMLNSPRIEQVISQREKESVSECF
jgi:hypothetical protein